MCHGLTSNPWHTDGSCSPPCYGRRDHFSARWSSAARSPPRLALPNFSVRGSDTWTSDT